MKFWTTTLARSWWEWRSGLPAFSSRFLDEGHKIYVYVEFHTGVRERVIVAVGELQYCMRLV